VTKLTQFEPLLDRALAFKWLLIRASSTDIININVFIGVIQITMILLDLTLTLCELQNQFTLFSWVVSQGAISKAAATVPSAILAGQSVGSLNFVQTSSATLSDRKGRVEI
jgi:hypothetical protein